MAQAVQPGCHEVQAGELRQHLPLMNTDDTDWAGLMNGSAFISAPSVVPVVRFSLAWVNNSAGGNRSMPIFKPLSVMVMVCAIAGVARSHAWAQTASSLSQEDKDAEVRQLRELVLKLQARVEQLEAHEHAVDPSPHRLGAPSADGEGQAVAAPSPSPAP